MLRFKITFSALVIVLLTVGCSSSSSDSDPDEMSTTNAGSSDSDSTAGDPSDDPGETDGASDSGGTDGSTDDGSDGGSTDGGTSSGGTDGSSDGSDGGGTDAGASNAVCRADTRAAGDEGCIDVSDSKKFAIISFSSENNDGQHAGGGAVIDTDLTGGVYGNLVQNLRNVFAYTDNGTVCFWDNLQDNEPSQNEFIGNDLIPQNIFSIVLLNAGESLQLQDAEGNFTGQLNADVFDAQGQQYTVYEGTASSLSKYLIFPGTQEVQAATVSVNLPGVYTPINTIFTPADTPNGLDWTVEGVAEGVNSIMFVTWYFQRPNGDKYNLDCFSDGSLGHIDINATGTPAPNDATLIRLQTSVGTVTVGQEGNLTVMVLSLSLIDETF